MLKIFKFLMNCIALFYILCYIYHMEDFMKRSSWLFVICIMAFSVGMILTNCDTNGTTTYTVTFDSNGGSTVTAISGISSGSTITLPEEPTKDFATFIGWYTDNTTFLNEFTSSTAVSTNIIIYAKWDSTGNTENKIIAFTATTDNQYAVWLSSTRGETKEAFFAGYAAGVSGGLTISSGTGSIALKSVEDNLPTENPWNGFGNYYVYLMEYTTSGPQWLSKNKILFNSATTTITFDSSEWDSVSWTYP
jgi:hypothetical protein